MFKRRKKEATEAITLSVQRSSGDVSQLKYVRGQVPTKGSRLKIYGRHGHTLNVSINGGEAVFCAEPLNDDTYRVGEMMSLQNTERTPLNTT